MLRTFNLDCNAIALDLRIGLFLDGGAIRAVQQKQIDFVHRAVRHTEETFAAKALLLDLRVKYVLSGELIQFINTHLQVPSLSYEAGKIFPRFVVLPTS